MKIVGGVKMIEIRKHDDLNIQIVTDNRSVILGIKDYFTDFVEGYRFMPKYKAGGRWDGKICLVGAGNILPYGLLFDTIKCIKTKFKEEELIVSNDVKELFMGDETIEPEFDLNIIPRPYQLECIMACLKYKKGIVVAATASGKSCTIAYVIKTLMDNCLVTKTLIIVPTLSLVEQFYKDLGEYGMDINNVGRVYSKIKEFNKPIVISTWQTLVKNYDKLEDFDCVICDEVHSAKALSIKTILSKCENAAWRFGFTGTMPPDKLSNWNVRAYLGPVIKTFGAAELAEQGFIAPCKVDFTNIDYIDGEMIKGEYADVKAKVFNNPNRLRFLKDIVTKADSNILVLVGQVDKEGKVLQEYFEKKGGIPGKEIIFLYGDTKVEDRESWRAECENRKNIILIATYGILQVGVNIPSLKYILFASPFKSRIRVLQSIGRSLRLHDEKEFATIYDIADNVLFLGDHSVKRLRYYHTEKFTVNETFLDEKTLAFI